MPIRATVSDFGPQLLGKVLEANDTQEQSLALVFRFADESGLPLLDLADLRALLTYLDSDAGKQSLKGIGGVSSATIGVLLRKLVAVEDGGGTEFFGEPQLNVPDLLRVAPDGRGIVSCLELPAVQDKPRLWSTALMWLLAELFEELPEVGDLEQPKLVFFFDEAHLLFADATDAFLDSVVQTVRMIRSKGVGVFFCTQVPKDVHKDVLAQLGNRIQHALRAFTPEDAKALKAAISTYPKSDFYDLEELLPSLGIGEAAVTILSENGVPTPVVHTRMRAPASAHGSRRRRGRRRAGLEPLGRLRDEGRSGERPRAPRRPARAAGAAGAGPDAEAPPQGGGARLREGRRRADRFPRLARGHGARREIVRGVFGMLRKHL